MNADQFGLTSDEAALALESIVQAAGPNGIEEDEAQRQMDLVVKQLIELKLSAALWDLFRTEQLRVALNEHNELAFHPKEETAS